ncbi:MAG: DUF58 domain-containing protein [Anaerolineales bacterium]|uniref:DUF58 domain-containing protein n=1 Tax=Promineifilum sp. TaxID=2664178 RepID=UPI001E189357|nr:DUF58 domain-containing protein [Anaerolineales bacterium]MCB8935137.1 DUF58 domain-containing protein [Promineifilum sp.]MCO5179132.1 DUF58 domain-containing protein [Promineifilum sp.]
MTLFRWLILLLLGVAFLLRVDFVFYILYVAIGIFAWSQWNNTRALRKIVATRDYRRRAFLGESVDVKLTLQNNSRLAVPWVQFHESIPPELRLETPIRQVTGLRGHQSLSFFYKVKALQRGYYRLGPLQLTSGDLFGLAKPRAGTLRPDFLTVYPRIIPLTQLGLPSRLPFGTIADHRRLFEDPARPMGVREFRSGDSLRQMNWKASAHTQKLMVRTLEPAISLETAILLDLHTAGYERRNRYDSIEWAIVIAASLANHLIDRRQAVGLLTNGVDPLRLQEDARVFDDVSGRLLFQSVDTTGDLARYMATATEARTGRSHLMKILELLARVDGHDTVPFTAWASAACVHQSWGITLLAITGAGDIDTCNTLHRLARAGFNPILIAIEPDANFGVVRERARRLGFQAFNVHNRRELAQWQRPVGNFKREGSRL